ncbi:UDP-N-acetylmuramoyl-L-alanine--D-glutamate ligase [Catenovulum sediminis]|uniref:UDP-N-acetylmuramoylalanine--D-glutamate ligase n=1 Tax=Catenovulum sediminis TaxID=1740262 RepID=A0ABV1RBW4_9ALTE
MNKIVIWGFGREGRSCYNYALKRWPEADIKVLTDEYDISLFNELKGSYIFGETGLELLAAGDFDLIIKSPGISLYRQELQKATKEGSLLTSSTNLWFEENRNAKTIIVSGTKGKSTTASLLAYLMQNLGLDVTLAGNIGLPLLDVKAGKDWTILELSSYQLADFHGHCDGFILLNLYQEHVPWHTSAKQYFYDKTRILHKSLSELAVINDNSHLSKQLSKPFKGHLVSFGTEQGFNVVDHKLYFKDEELNHNFKLKGEHNLKNLAASLALIDALALNWKCVLTKLNGFNGLAHRLQEFHFENGILCVDDSISTTPDSTLCALEAYREKEIHLILGGTERAQNYDKFISQLAQFNIQHIVLIGQTGKRLANELAQAKCKFKFDWRVYTSLEEGMSALAEKVQTNQSILLSPAAPSFDLFKDYQHRGEVFINLANQFFSGRDKDS